MNLKIQILFDNVPKEPDFETALGYSCLINLDNNFLLFDTGADPSILKHNLEKAKINLKKIPFLVLSHYHWDHVGGLETVLNLNPEIEIYAGSSFAKDIKLGFPQAKVNAISREPFKITEQFYVTGELEGPPLENSLVIDTPKGLVIITGCAHPGLKKILTRALQIKNKKIFLLMGGFHLVSKTESEILEIIQFIKNLNVEYVAPSHCTGDLALKLFKDRFSEKFIKVGAGSILKFEV